MSKGLLNEAKDEFKKVIAVIPDNLYAHKKLAEIYQELGDRDNAKNELETVLNLNPNDEWALSNIAAIEREQVPMSEKVMEELIPSSVAEISEEDRHSFVADAASTEELAVAVSAGEEESVQIPGRISHDEEFGEDLSALETGLEHPEQPDRGILETVTEGAGSRDFMIADAEEYIKHGDYRKAMEIYRALLAENSADRIVLQRIAELKSLLKILRKDQDAHIAQLEVFLEKIKKRGTEFLGNL